MRRARQACSKSVLYITPIYILHTGCPAILSQYIQIIHWAGIIGHSVCMNIQGGQSYGRARCRPLNGYHRRVDRVREEVCCRDIRLLPRSLEESVCLLLGAERRYTGCWENIA